MVSKPHIPYPVKGHIVTRDQRQKKEGNIRLVHALRKFTTYLVGTRPTYLATYNALNPPPLSRVQAKSPSVALTTLGLLSASSSLP